MGAILRKWCGDCCGWGGASISLSDLNWRSTGPSASSGQALRQAQAERGYANSLPLAMLNWRSTGPSASSGQALRQAQAERGYANSLPLAMLIGGALAFDRLRPNVLKCQLTSSGSAELAEHWPSTGSGRTYSNANSLPLATPIGGALAFDKLRASGVSSTRSLQFCGE